MQFHQGSVTCLASSQQFLLSGSADKQVVLWRMADWTPLHVLKGHQAPVEQIAIHPSGRLALSVASDGMVIMWDLMRGVAAVSRKASGCKGVCMAPGGRHYALLHQSSVEVVEAETGCVQNVEVGREKAAPTCCCFLDNATLLLGDAQGRLLVAPVDGKCTVLERRHESRVKQVLVVGERAISVCTQGLFVVWEVVGRKLTPCQELEANIRVTCLASISGTTRVRKRKRKQGSGEPKAKQK